MQGGRGGTAPLRRRVIVVQCPSCRSRSALGVLNRQHRRDNGDVLVTFFCSHCCIEFVTRNGRVVNILMIDADGEVTPHQARQEALA